MNETVQDLRFLDSLETWRFGDLDLPDELRVALKKDNEAHSKCIRLMNRCLDAHWMIWGKVKDDENLRAEYEDVLTSGFGFGISDFEEVLAELETVPQFRASPDILTDRRPHWLDRAFLEYEQTPAPVGFVNYMKALDSKAEEFSEAVAVIMPELKAMVDAIEEKRWDTVKEAGEIIEKHAKRAEMVLWYVGEERAFASSAITGLKFPDSMEGARKEAAFAAFEEMGEISKAQALVSQVSSYAGLVGKVNAIKSSAELMMDLETKGELDPTEAAALGAIHYACGFLPLFGAVYQEAIKWLIGFLPQWRKIFADKERIATDVVGFLKEREKRLREERESDSF